MAVYKLVLLLLKKKYSVTLVMHSKEDFSQGDHDGHGDHSVGFRDQTQLNTACPTGHLQTRNSEGIRGQKTPKQKHWGHGGFCQ